MEWSNEKVIEFLEILQTEPCLWDPKHKYYKNRVSQNVAWTRILELLSFNTSIDDIKKKKESLMGYYRIHLNKYKKSLKTATGKDDVYTTNWFAFDTMDSFLRVVYASNLSSHNMMSEDSDAQERNEGESERNENSPHLLIETSENIQRENRTLQREKSSTFDLKSSGRNRQTRDDLTSETRAAHPLHQMDTTFEYMTNTQDDEYETFGKLIAIKLKKIRNPNTREILMNDIQNLVFRTSMRDRVEHTPSNQLLPGPTTSQVSQQILSPSPDPYTYQPPLSPDDDKTHVIKIDST